MNEVENAIKAIQAMIEKNKYSAKYEEDEEIVAKRLAENDVLNVALTALREKLDKANTL